MFSLATPALCAERYDAHSTHETFVKHGDGRTADCRVTVPATHRTHTPLAHCTSSSQVSNERTSKLYRFILFLQMHCRLIWLIGWLLTMRHGDAMDFGPTLPIAGKTGKATCAVAHTDYARLK